MSLSANPINTILYGINPTDNSRVKKMLEDQGIDSSNFEIISKASNKAGDVRYSVITREQRNDMSGWLINYCFRKL